VRSSFKNLLLVVHFYQCWLQYDLWTHLDQRSGGKSTLFARSRQALKTINFTSDGSERQNRHTGNKKYHFLERLRRSGIGPAATNSICGKGPNNTQWGPYRFLDDKTSELRNYS